MLSTSRKPRTVKNPLTNIDSVTVQPGINYCNWIEISKQKLKERESTMLKIRVKKIESVVNDCRVNKIELSPSNNFELPQNIIDNAIELLYHSINQWCGVKLSKTKSSLSTYKNYFNTGKKWWDGRKKIMLGYIFWLPVFKHVDQFVNYDLGLKMINALFNSTVKFPSTKPVSLINGGSLIQSEEMQTYLYHKNHSLNIKQWISDVSDDNKSKAKSIMNKVKDVLTQIISNRVVAPPVLNSNPSTNNNAQINVSRSNNFNLNMSFNNQTFPQYNGVHHSTFPVSGTRYTPFLSLPINRQSINNNTPNCPMYLIVNYTPQPWPPSNVYLMYY